MIWDIIEIKSVVAMNMNNVYTDEQIRGTGIRWYMIR